MVVVEIFYRAAIAVDRVTLQVVPPQRVGPIPDAQRPIEMLVDQDSALREATPQRGGGDLERHPAVLDGVVVRDGALVLADHDKRNTITITGPTGSVSLQ